MAPLDHATTDIPIGIGCYTVPEAARLLRIRPVSIRRWLGGRQPLWQPQLPASDGHFELGFRDLIELRFVGAFAERGVGLQTIRACLDAARRLVGDDRPFSKQRFRTAGRSTFLETIETRIMETPEPGERQLLDLKRRQHVLAEIFDRSFRDLELDAEQVVRWRPYRGKDSIVIDPNRAFGQPIVNAAGIPTATLAAAVNAEGGSYARVAWLYQVDRSALRDAVRFESELGAA